MNVTTISPKQLYDLVQSGASVDLIDVRTPVEYREVHADFAEVRVTALATRSELAVAA